MKRAGTMVALILLGCATTTRGPVSAYSLSATDLATVGRGLHAALKDLDSPEFRNFKAVQSADGRISVCGWVLDRGEYSDKPPFIGTLSAGQFVLDQLGQHRTARDEVLKRCAELGINLN